MPYQTDWADFERYDGAIEVNGVHYKYVKRKIEGGQLVLKCIPNKVKQQLESAKQDIFKSTNDIQQDNGSKKSGNSNPGLVKNVLGDYDDLQQGYLESRFMDALSNTYNHYQPYLVLNSAHTTPEQPPEC